MSDFLTEHDCVPNLNTATLAGKVIRVEPLTGKTAGLAFTVGYTKHWPAGGTQEIPIRCYATGAERLEQLAWLKAGEVVLVHGEITDKTAVYAHQIVHLSAPAREHGRDDAYLSGMSRRGKQ